jgi:zinc transport system substrate-binding protein
MKYFRIILGICILVGTILAVSYRVQKVPEDSRKLSVVTTLFPLYDFVKIIGADKVDVTLLLPPGMEAHSFEPKPSDVVKINKADIFIYTGQFMEPWAEDIISGISDSKVKVVNASTGIKMIPGVFNDEDEPVGSMDPHIWLDFDNDKVMIQTIATALAEKDTVHAKYYQQKAQEYQNTLSRLDAEYKTSLSRCKSNEIIYGGHYAFGYLAHRYNLKYLAAQGVSPDAEPTAQDLAQLVDQIRKNHIQYVFYEELTSPKIAKTLANETDAKLLQLNAAHNISKTDYENNISFVSIMEDNLKNLQIGLHCSQ